LVHRCRSHYIFNADDRFCFRHIRWLYSTSI